MSPDRPDLQIELPLQPGRNGLKRVEHYALYLINGMASGGGGCLTDGDIDFAIDTAERLASRLVERGHLSSHEK